MKTAFTSQAAGDAIKNRTDAHKSSVLLLCPSLASIGPDFSELCRSVAEQVRAQTESDRLLVVLPRQAKKVFAEMPGADLVLYDGDFDFEHSYEAWGKLREQTFSAVVVYGVEPTADAHLLITANFLNADEQIYVRHGEGQEELSIWHDQVVMGAEDRPVQIKRLPKAEGAAYRQQVNQWAVNTVAKTNFEVVERIRDRQTNIANYSTGSYLGLDLAMQTQDLHKDEFGVSWSHFMLPDGDFAATSDYHRAIANYINAIPGVRSVLDVGCGSGFAGFHLANNPRYDRVVGVDGAAPRVRSAEFHARLHGNRAEYHRMDMANLTFPDKAFDVTISCAALEQAADFLDDALAEILRVTRRMAILVEPTIEYFSTFPGYINVLTTGWARGYTENLIRLGRPFAVRPYLFAHYYNPVSMIVINAEDDASPAARYPQLFNLAVDEWPGGVIELQADQFLNKARFMNCTI